MNKGLTKEQFIELLNAESTMHPAEKLEKIMALHEFLMTLDDPAGYELDGNGD